MASLQATTPVHSHPLSVDEGSRRTRGRGSQVPDNHMRSPTNYFTLKARLESSADADTDDSRATWDGSVRGYGKKDKRRSAATLPFTCTRSNRCFPRTALAAPVIVVDRAEHSGFDNITDSLFPDDSPFDVGPAQTAQMLETKWHEYSDEAIQSTISRLGAANSPSEAPSNPYHDTLRVLSSAVHRLSKARAELEESRKELLEKEASRRARAEQLMKELQPSEQEVARRVLQSLFPDDDESRREVQRKHSDTVREHSDF